MALDVVEETGQPAGAVAGFTAHGRPSREARARRRSLTFDPTSLQQQVNDPDALTDFRTPRYRLDSLYGRSPQRRHPALGLHPQGGGGRPPGVITLGDLLHFATR